MTKKSINTAPDLNFTPTSIIIADKQFAKTSIKSAKSTTTTGNLILPLLLFFIGMTIFLSTLEEFRNASDAELTEHILILLFSVAMLALTSVWFKMCLPKYHVIVSSNSGDIDALSSKDKAQVDMIVERINKAIIPL